MGSFDNDTFLSKGDIEKIKTMNSMTEQDNDKINKDNVTSAEVILSCFGRNEIGEANAEISSSLLLYTGDDSEAAKTNDLNYKEVSTRLSKQGEFLLEARNGLVQVDIKYKSNMNAEFRLFWQQLEDYGRRISAFNLGLNNDDNDDNDEINNDGNDNNDKGIPLLFYTIIPDEYADKYYISLANPFMWVLQPESPEDEKLNILRMFFKSEDVDIKELPDQIDITQARAEAERPYNVIYTEN